MTSMSRLNEYLDAAERENTRKSYESALRHFEIEWKGFLPATGESIARYLADYAATLSFNTLRSRLSAISRWHTENGFADPTRLPVVRQVLKGIRSIHSEPEKRARPLHLEQVQQVDNWLARGLALANNQEDSARAMRLARDRALLLLGFWRGFRADELVHLTIERVEVTASEGLTCYLPRSKGDRQLEGRTFHCPALSRLCPVTAYQSWIALSGLTAGPVFRKIDRWGHVAESGLAPNSLIPLLRDLFAAAGVTNSEEFSSHSLRRGFAGWARANGWDLKDLMAYVGWKDIKSAMRYLDGAETGLKERFEDGLGKALIAHPSKSIPRLPDMPDVALATIEVSIQLSAYNGSSKVRAKALRDITESCLARFQGHQVDQDGQLYQIAIPAPSADALDDFLYAFLDELHQIADARECFLEAVCRDPASGKHWD